MEVENCEYTGKGRTKRLHTNKKAKRQVHLQYLHICKVKYCGETKDYKQVFSDIISKIEYREKYK